MSAVRIIACLDTRRGSVVKGVGFENLKDCGDPTERAFAYYKSGADEITVLDVGATPDRNDFASDMLMGMTKKVFVPICAGGGIRSVDDIRAVLRAGADKVSICSTALSNPELLTQASREFGSQCIVLSLDARRNGSRWDAYSAGGRTNSGRDAIVWAKEAESRGVGEILINSIDNDGTGVGYDLELLAAVRNAVRIPIIASGGGGSLESMYEAVMTGVDAVLLASVLHNKVVTIGEIKMFLRMKGVEVR